MVHFDVCSEQEAMNVVQVFMIYWLPLLVLLLGTIVLFPATSFFFNQLNRVDAPSLTFVDKAIVLLSYLQVFFLLPLVLSPQWKYTLVAGVVTGLQVVAAGSAIRYASRAALFLQTLFVLYLFDPLGGNQFLTFSEHRGVRGGSQAAQGSGLWFNVRQNHPWISDRADSNVAGTVASPSYHYRRMGNMLGMGARSNDVERGEPAYAANFHNFHRSTFRGENMAGDVATYCTNYYLGYFRRDARLIDLDRQSNPDADGVFGYCAWDWTIFLLITSAFGLLAALTAFLLGIHKWVAERADAEASPSSDDDADVKQFEPAVVAPSAHGPTYPGVIEYVQT
jgi:hypothetical protein